MALWCPWMGAKPWHRGVRFEVILASRKNRSMLKVSWSKTLAVMDEQLIGRKRSELLRNLKSRNFVIDARRNLLANLKMGLGEAGTRDVSRRD